MQVRRYAQPATAPSPDAYEESSTRNPASNKDAAQFPFPSKKNPSPYEIMHLPMSADPKDIKQRYYRLALLYHPDSTHPSSSPHHFSLLNRAYKLLSSPHARATYHRTGLGWGSANDVAAGRTGVGGFNRASDEELRRQARARAYSYAYSGNGASSGGGGAGYTGYANGRGGHAYDQARWGEGPDGMGNPNPNGNYTTNTRFIGSLFIISVLFSMIQYNRAINASLWTQELMDAKDVGASQALAEAKQEAALYGRERRERIRRRVRSNEVEREYERRMAEAEARAAGAARFPSVPDDGGLEAEVPNDRVIRDMLKP
ncbi:hypothetical protein QFC20_000028 [Naganishia adeliensis]|uniref:Uncharacterized protein n=1 Tax=Naganishia adeliensis TaxID=92952 RepID=A0ACC2X2Y9_9TREE|nr:hypothetical protein QFC20_000028 [Naganishia adeliensis]